LCVYHEDGLWAEVCSRDKTGCALRLYPESGFVEIKLPENGLEERR
jgi:hypothetical protein